MDKTNHNCAMRQNGVRCGLPLVLLPEGLLYCRRCNAVKVVGEQQNEQGKRRVRTVLTDDERATLGLHGPAAPDGLYTATQALAKGWIPTTSVLADCVRNHGDAWAKGLA